MFLLVFASNAYAFDKKIERYREEAKTLQNDAVEKVTGFQNEVVMEKDDLTKDGTRRLVFVSFSMPDGVLENIIGRAKVYGFSPVLRGFKDNSYIKTVQALQGIIEKTGYGVVIDPEVFREFAVTVVPTFVIVKGGKITKLSGNVSFEYVLEK